MIDERSLLNKIDEMFERGKAKPKNNSYDFERWQGMLRAYLRVKDEIEKMPKAGEWIPASERLPKEDGEYLVWYDCGEDEEDFERGFMLVPFWTDIEKFGVYQDKFHPETLGFLDSEFYECETAVAWMPLPEPYKGVE